MGVAAGIIYVASGRAEFTKTCVETEKSGVTGGREKSLISRARQENARPQHSGRLNEINSSLGSQEAVVGEYTRRIWPAGSS